MSDRDQTARGPRRPRRGRGPKPDSRPPPTDRGAPALDLGRPADLPLTDAEIAEVRQHLAFLRRYRRVLRLPVNATEARLIDGSDPPTHRGTCKHLLSKVDRNAIAGALARQPLSDNAKARADFLAGAAAVSRDLGVLLDSLEAAAQVQTRRAAARDFADAVAQIDFSEISAARMARFLALMAEVHRSDELPHVLFGMLDSESFRDAFDKHADRLDPSLSSAFAPLRAVYKTLIGRALSASEQPLLAEGLHTLLTGSDDALSALRRGTRERLASAALELDVPWATDCGGVHRAIREAQGAVAVGLGHLRATRLAQRGRFDEAIPRLEELVSAHPEAIPSAMLLDWLRRPRLGPVALEAVVPGPLQAGFHIPRLVPVRVNVGPVAAVAAAAELHAAACLPGVTGVVDHGAAGDLAWVAVPPLPMPLVDGVASMGRSLSYEEARHLASEGVRILRALALLGIELPDARPTRFVADLSGSRPQLLIADLSGAIETEPARADVAHRTVAGAWCRAVLAWPPLEGNQLRREVSVRLTGAFDAKWPLPALAAALDRGA